jgi:LytS/YehU family sensor histidine kinase
MQALRAQMNPHFIFNCLSSINRFILKNKTEEASDYLTKFSRLIRMVLNNSKQSFISLEDELETLRLYLEMERLRFKNSFDYNFSYRNAVDVGNIFIPPLLLEPFAENAIWHGLMHKQEKGFLNFDFSTEDKFLSCIITDNGVGREQAELLKSKSAEKQKSMGLKITTERLSLLNNNSNQQTFFTIEDLVDENGNALGTRVHLKIFYKEMMEV